MNATQVQMHDLRDTVSNFLKNVLPIGDGLYGARTTPFSEFIGKFYNPANFQNMYDYAYRVVSDAGKPVATKPYKLAAAESLGNGSVILDDLASEILNFTLNDDKTSLIRNLVRACYLSGFPKNAAGAICEEDINSFNISNEPMVILTLLSKMAPLEMSLAEKESVSAMMNNGLLDMLSILKASGNMNAYKLALKLCNISESYFSLASAVRNMVNASLQIVPQSPMNMMAATAKTATVGAVDATIPVNTQNQIMSIQQLVQRYAQDINNIAQYLNNSPRGVELYNTLMSIGGNLSETALNNVHAILNGALIKPELAYNLNIDDALVSAINAQGNLFPHVITVAITYVMLSIQGLQATPYLSSIGIQLFQMRTDILTNMMEDVKNGEVVRTVVCTRNPANGNLGRVLDHYVKTRLANRKPVRLADVLQYTRATTGNTSNTITVRDVANYLQSIEPQFYGTSNPEVIMQFADILYRLNL